MGVNLIEMLLLKMGKEEEGMRLEASRR